MKLTIVPEPLLILFSAFGTTMNDFSALRKTAVAAIPVCILAFSVGLLFSGCHRVGGREEKPSDNYVKNGDFEKVDNGSFPHWKVSGNVKPEAVSGVWRRYTVRFNSGKFREVNFYFHVNQGSMGTIWIDHVTCSSAQIGNGGFEEQGPDGRPDRWIFDAIAMPAYTAARNPWGVTLFLDSNHAADGKKSIRITHAHDAIPMSRLRQQITVEPNREYAVSYDVLVGDDFQGDAIGYVYDVTGKSHLTINYDENWVSWQIENRDRCGKQVAVLSPTEKSPAEMTQEASVKPGMNLQVSMDINNKAFSGTARLVVEDPVSRRVLGESNAVKVNAKWQRMQFLFQSALPQLRIRVLAGGSGTLQVDNVAVTPPVVTPPLQQVRWLPATQNFSVPAQLGFSIQGQPGKAIDGGLELLADDLKKYGVKSEKSGSKETPLKIIIGSDSAVKGKGAEAYSLGVNQKGITIKAGAEPGAFYGLMTLLQLIKSGEGKPVVLACEITDYPDMPMRGVLYGDAEQAARWKMNTLMYSTGYPTSIEERKSLSDVVQKCERLNLKVSPYFLSLMGGYYVQKINPNLAAGIWVKDEPLTLRGLEPAPLTNRYVIRTGLTDVKMKSQDGKETYVLGKDYQVINGDMALWYNDPKAKPFAVARLPGSSIPDGGSVFASYDHVSHYRASDERTETHIAYCPLEPETRKLMGDFMRDLAKDYRMPYIGPNYCLMEFRPTEAQLETDSRVINSGKKPIELLAEDACSMDKAAKAGNPDVRLLLWSGNINEYAKTAGPLLPKDAHINIWGYDAPWPVAYGRETVAYWSKLGFETSVMPWDNLQNVRGWAQVVAEARKKGYPCLGMIDSIWDKRAGGFQETAMVSWKIPKAGEKGFVSLPKTEDVKPKEENNK